MLFADIAATSERVRATRSRRAKIAALAECLADLRPDELEAGVGYLAGEPRQPTLGIGHAALRAVDPSPAAPPPTLEVGDVDAALETISAARGPGSRKIREETLRELLAAATEGERRLLRGLIVRDVRQGALEGLLVEAVARAAGVPADAVRRALMLAGDVRPVAAAALQAGSEGLGAFRLTPFQPLRPMLAQTAATVAAAIGKIGPAAVEHKLDGARIQVHRVSDRIEIYTRNLREVTPRIPEITERIAALDVDSIILDGEAIALDEESRPLPFQTTMRRFGTEQDVAAQRERVPLHAFFFDCLHLDGVDLLDAPARERFAAMTERLPPELRVARIETDSADEAEAFWRAALESGQEGVVVKDLEAAYAAGRRGASWLKVKPAHTLDLVILAAEWGSGRRRGFLSNLHLGARDPGGGFVMLGKTFKGLTDETLAWQTRRFLELETHREGHVVFVRPETVAEIAFDGIQSSPRYPGGMALRFARLKGYRPDKTAEEADTIDTVRGIFEGRA